MRTTRLRLVLYWDSILSCCVCWRVLDLTEAQTHGIVGIRPMVMVPATHKMRSSVCSRLVLSEIALGVVDGRQLALVGVSGFRTVDVMLGLDGPRGRWGAHFHYLSGQAPSIVSWTVIPEINHYQTTPAHRPRPGWRWHGSDHGMRSCGRIVP